MKKILFLILSVLLVQSNVFAQETAAQVSRPAVESQANQTTLSGGGDAGTAVEKDQKKPFAVLQSRESLTDQKMVEKTLTGSVGAKGATGLALVYEKNEKERSSSEIWFPFESELNLTGYKSAKDIEEGDQVKVTYGEAEDGSKRILTGVTLEKKKLKEEELAEEEDEVEVRGEIK